MTIFSFLSQHFIGVFKQQKVSLFILFGTHICIYSTADMISNNEQCLQQDAYLYTIVINTHLEHFAQVDVF